MFIVLLRFTENRDRAPAFGEGHKAWIKQGIDDGIFLMAGSVLPKTGGMILAHGTTLPDLTARVNADPFVAEGVVTSEILEIAPAVAADRFAFLLG